MDTNDAKLMAAIEAHPTTEQVKALIELARATVAYLDRGDTSEDRAVWRERREAKAAMEREPTEENARRYVAAVLAEQTATASRHDAYRIMHEAYEDHADSLRGLWQAGGAA